MAGHTRDGLMRRTYEVTLNGTTFIIVAVCGVITEASAVAKTAVGHDMLWLKQQLKKYETNVYSAKELERPTPLWLQHTDFVGVFDNGDKNTGKVIVDREANITQREFERQVMQSPMPKEETKLPNIKGVKFM